MEFLNYLVPLNDAYSLGAQLIFVLLMGHTIRKHARYTSGYSYCRHRPSRLLLDNTLKMEKENDDKEKM